MKTEEARPLMRRWLKDMCEPSDLIAIISNPLEAHAYATNIRAAGIRVDHYIEVQQEARDLLEIARAAGVVH